MPPTRSDESGNEQDTGSDDQPVEMDTFDVPADLTVLDDTELESLTTRVGAAIQIAAGIENPSAEEVDYAVALAGARTALEAEAQRRQDEAADRNARFRAALGLDAPSASDQGGDGGDAGDQPDGGDELAGDQPDGGDGGEDEPTTAAARPALTITMPRVPVLNPSLEAIAAQRRADGYQDNDLDTDRRPEVVITAAADVPRRSPGARLETMDDLVDACIHRSKALGITQGNPAFTPLATIKRQFPLTYDERVHPDAVREKFEELVRPHARDAQSFSALVAAGGWCAPSEIRYEFFNIAQVSGMLDLPTFGVNRGGIRWPQSLSLADFFALSGAPASGVPTNATMPWQWTEADDIAATGASPRKVCLRPPCPSFDEERLIAYGLCVLAGNLTMDAFPELIRDFIAKVIVAHARVMNRQHIAELVAGSTGTTPTSLADQSATTHILGGYELNAIDYRERHGMAETAVLEGVLPSWVRGLMRSDLAKRNGWSSPDGLRVADSELMRFFDERQIRMQWVSDWQTRGAAGGIAAAGGSIPTNWPTSVIGLLFAPGTWGRGNGMNLDLGVVRDSVLNATNDHTAAWSEEATLIAKFGHESRAITFTNLEATGTSGPQVALSPGSPVSGP